MTIYREGMKNTTNMFTGYRYLGTAQKTIDNKMEGNCLAFSIDISI